MTPTWNPTDRVLRLSGSSLSTWQRCPRSWYHSHLLGLVKPGPISIPALFGGACHEALALLYAGESLAVALQAIDRHYHGTTLPQEEWRTPGKAKEVVEKYQTQMLEDAWEVISQNTVRLIEYEFTLPLGVVQAPGGPVEVAWSGYVDLGVRHRQQGVVVDHKFTSRDSDFTRLRAKYEMSRSILGYLYALEELGWGSFTSAMVNEVVVRPPVAREGAKTKPRIEFGPAHRLTVPFSATRKARWKSEVLDLATQIAAQLDQWCTTPWPFPRFDTGCAFPSICPYHTACSMDSEEDYSNVLHGGEFVQKTDRSTTPEPPDDE